MHGTLIAMTLRWRTISSSPGICAIRSRRSSWHAPAVRVLAPCVAAAVLMIATGAEAQETDDKVQAPQPAAAAKKWSFSASAYTYFVPDDADYVSPAFKADRGRLHLEARYNYEDRNTGSVWAGYNFSVGEKLTFEFTPMLGGIFGDTNGVAPGFEMTLGWRKLELYSESEYVFDPGDHSANFAYTWSEVTLAPVDWFRFGLVAQRTRAYQSDLDVQRGLLAGFSYKRADFGAYLFNPDRDQPMFVFSVAVNF